MLTSRNVSVGGVLACGFAGVLWGMGFLFGKFALREMDFGYVILFRYVFAAVFALPLLLRFRTTLCARDGVILVLTALIGGPVQFLLQFFGLSMTTVSHASFMVGFMPVLIALSAAVFTRERVGTLVWCAFLGSGVGVLLIAFGRNVEQEQSASLIGDLAVLLSLVVAVAWLFLTRRLVQRYGHGPISMYNIFLSTAFLGLWVPSVHTAPPLTQVSTTSWVCLILAGVLSTSVAALLWNWGAGHLRASHAGALLNIDPLVGSLLGVFVLNEPAGIEFWGGGLLILACTLYITIATCRELDEQLSPRGTTESDPVLSTVSKV